VGQDGSRIELNYFSDGPAEVFFYDADDNRVGVPQLVELSRDKLSMLLNNANDLTLVEKASLAVNIASCGVAVGTIVGSSGSALPAYASAVSSCGSVVITAGTLAGIDQVTILEPVVNASSCLSFVTDPSITGIFSGPAKCVSTISTVVSSASNIILAIWRPISQIFI